MSWIRLTILLFQLTLAGMNRVTWFSLPTSHHAAGYPKHIPMAVEKKEDRRHAQLCNHFQDSLIYVC